jgi:hypothetical protein
VPYDLEALTADLTHRTHPFVAHGEDRQASATFRPVDLADPFARSLPACPADAAYLAFQPGGLDRLRIVRRPADPAGRAGRGVRHRDSAGGQTRSPPTASGTAAGTANSAPGPRAVCSCARCPTTATSPHRWLAACHRLLLRRPEPGCGLPTSSAISRRSAPIPVAPPSASTRPADSPRTDRAPGPCGCTRQSMTTGRSPPR